MTVLSPVSLRTVVARLQSGKREEAARFLAALFGLNEERGSMCADHFAAKVSQQPELLLKSMQLRSAVQACRYNHVVSLLQECFGLRTVESMQVLRNLTHRFSRDDSKS
jgi:hypothetical protein